MWNEFSKSGRRGSCILAEALNNYETAAWPPARLQSLTYCNLAGRAANFCRIVARILNRRIGPLLRQAARAILATFFPGARYFRTIQCAGRHGSTAKRGPGTPNSFHS
jgi:hypothetical protein